MTRRLWLAGFLLLPACASAPSTTPVQPASRTIAYAVPSPATATYAFADSSSFDIQSGAMGDIHANIGSAGIAEITYSAKGPDVETNIRITQLAGSMTNSQMGGGPSATQADIEGAAVLAVSPRGIATVTTMPKLTPAVEQIGVTEGFFRRFFVRLPAAQVGKGAVWVDTIAVNEKHEQITSDLRDVVTSTLVGDTVVNGRTLSHITTMTQRNLTIAGMNQGVSIAQKLTGTATGSILWDAQRNLLVERTEQTELSGTFDLPQMGMTGMPLKARGNGRLTLR
ncbi:MAG TPA: hypothetical protein VF021_04710 [Longimicrobiales bacterium]